MSVWHFFLFALPVNSQPQIWFCFIFCGFFSVCLSVCLLSLDMVSLGFPRFPHTHDNPTALVKLLVFLKNKKFVRGLLEPLNVTGWLHFVKPTSWITAWSWAVCEAGSHGKTDIYQLGALASDSAFPASSIAWRKLSGSSTELLPNTEHCVSNVTVPRRAFTFFPTRLWIAYITDHGFNLYTDQIFLLTPFCHWSTEPHRWACTMHGDKGKTSESSFNTELL